MKLRPFAVFGTSIYLLASGLAQATEPPRSAHDVTSIVANDNRSASGIRHGHTIDVALDATTGRWQPDEAGRPTATVDAFAERGRAPQIPGPLLRATVGSEFRVRVRNTLVGMTLYVHNLGDLPSRNDKPLVVAPGEERIVRVHAYAPGTYFYWAATSNESIRKHVGKDSMLSGAIVVDAPGTKRDDRIFVINIWDDVYKKDGSPNFNYGVYTINGRLWPFTERLAYDKGSTATWHLVNASFESHPMHLHGFPFSVLGRGTGTDVTSPTDEREVTELLAPGTTARIRFTAARPGAWMFHCHIAYHMLPHHPKSLELAGGVGPRSATFAEGQHLAMTAGSAMHAMAMDDGGMNAAMGGLVLAVTVRDPKSAALPPQVQPSRRLSLVVDSGTAPAPNPQEPVYPQFRYSLATSGAAALAPTEMPATARDIGPTIFLVRGEPTGVTIVNHLDEATSVHWHGIELADSYQDGGGLADPWHRPAAMIMPGASREARFAAPRSGTFMYHTHMDDAWQLGGGLAGPLIVLEPGQRFDATTDHIVMVTSPRDARTWEHLNINGRPDPEPIAMTVGVPQRLRLMNLTEVHAEIGAFLKSANGALVPTWKLLARDGFALRTPLAVAGGIPFTIGATRDLWLRPTSVGNLALEIRNGDGSIVSTIPIHVTATKNVAIRNAHE